jgi:CRISPR-associated protein Csb2
MPTIELRFVAGKYHATPWGSHVNEAEVEWPPSPWRLIRALLATGFAKLGWETVPDHARALAYSLAGTQPSYLLPAGEIAQSRHYMPLIEGRKERTTRVIDAFVRLPSNEGLLIHFPVELPAEQRELLSILVQHLGYLGRAESWVGGRLRNDEAPGPTWCVPLEGGETGLPDRGEDQVSVLAPVAADTYAAWRVSAVEQALQQAEERRGGRLTRVQRARVEATYPVDLLACLMMDTSDIQVLGWNQPPGSRRVLYSRPAGTLERRPPAPSIGRMAEPVEAVLLALTSNTVYGQALPSLNRCLPQADLLHQALVKQGSECPVLTGRDPITDEALRGRHEHAYILPLDLDEDGRLDHFLIHAKMKLDGLAQHAIHRVERTWTKGRIDDIAITFAGSGRLADFAAQLRHRSGRPVATLETSRQWASITPFVPPRHLRKRGHTLEDQVAAELKSHRNLEARSISVLSRDELIDRGLLRFVRTRREAKPQPPAPLAFGLRIVFAQPIFGPLALGYASHFGLGVFAAEDV